MLSWALPLGASAPQGRALNWVASAQIDTTQFAAAEAGRAIYSAIFPCLHVYAFLFRHMAIIATHYEIEMCVPFERLPPGPLGHRGG